MTTQHCCIQFKESMAGGFALGINTPFEGSKQGNRLGTDGDSCHGDYR